MSNTSSEAAIIAIGNPGSGKSTILNAIAGEVLFKSGISFGQGLTDQLNVREYNGRKFIDTPGIADDTYRKQAGEAITTAFQKGGPHKIIFFVQTESGRIVSQDITTMKLVLDAAPEIGRKYGIIINQVPKNVMLGLKTAENAAILCTKLFVGIDETHRHDNILFLPKLDELEAENNKIVDMCKFPDLEEFLNFKVPIINLTKGKAREVKTSDFENINAIVE